jgi:hypothetical protein
VPLDENRTLVSKYPFRFVIGTAFSNLNPPLPESNSIRTCWGPDAKCAGRTQPQTVSGFPFEAFVDGR